MSTKKMFFIEFVGTFLIGYLHSYISLTFAPFLISDGVIKQLPIISL